MTLRTVVRDAAAVRAGALAPPLHVGHVRLLEAAMASPSLPVSNPLSSDGSVLVLASELRSNVQTATAATGQGLPPRSFVRAGVSRTLSAKCASH